MDEFNRLALAVLPFGNDAAFIPTRHGGLARIEPVSLEARTWLADYASKDATWDGSTLVVEMRYFPDFVDATIATEHSFKADFSAVHADSAKLANVEFDDTMSISSLRTEVESPLPWPGIHASRGEHATCR